ncbi:hypothetical protein BBJ28_00010869 [Nothophytophthora sp. Chile5]|nr:hypothetical protein BBJ28_00010869 [Nothophytophthora sp. Chile5]
MRLLNQLFQLAGLATATLLASASESVAAEPRCFPDDFLFGSATASYQVEGAWDEGGRTPSIWDDFCREKPGLKCGNVADDFYHRFRDDIQLMADMGLQSFRFSISWSRVMNWDPEMRRMRPNAEGVAFYHSLIDELGEKGIVPILTLYHWDLPTELQNELTPQGWLNPEIVDHYVQFATLMFHEFGSKVDYWTTFNEPYSFVGMGYGTGIHAPGFTGSDTQAYTVSHNVIVAHGKAVAVFRDMKARCVVKANARIGIVLVSSYFYPLDPSNPKDVAAANRALDFDFGWFLTPMITGDYPPSMRERAGDRLPTFTPEEVEVVKGSYDLLMMNHYASRAVTDCDSETSTVDCATLSAGWETDKGVDDTHTMTGTHRGLPDRHGNIYCEQETAYPPGYLAMIKWVHAHDPSADILLTENGWCGGDEIDNPRQLWYFQSYMEQVYKAVVEEKIPVVGYTAWSFMDNYEWGYYSPRFGLHHVNFTEQAGDEDEVTPKSTDLARIPRSAAKWFKKLATSKCLDGSTALEAGDVFPTALLAVDRIASERGEMAKSRIVVPFVGLVALVAVGVALGAIRARRRGYESI